MPRPKKPNVVSFKTTEPVKITSETGAALSKCLGITDVNISNQMISSVEEILTTYWSLQNTRSSAPTPAAMIIELKRLSKAALDLLKEFSSLNIFTVGQLYHQPRNPQIERQPSEAEKPKDQYPHDRETLYNTIGSIINRSAYAISSLEKSTERKGRPINIPLRNTLFLLAVAFLQYATDTNKSKKKNRNDFMSLALNAANITHPDPDEKTSRFSSLYEPTEQEKAFWESMRFSKPKKQ